MQKESQKLSPAEQNLVTQGWHQISFYKNGDMVTNVQKLKEFLKNLNEGETMSVATTDNSTRDKRKSGGGYGGIENFEGKYKVGSLWGIGETGIKMEGIRNQEMSSEEAMSSFEDNLIKQEAKEVRTKKNTIQESKQNKPDRKAKTSPKPQTSPKPKTSPKASPIKTTTPPKSSSITSPQKSDSKPSINEEMKQNLSQKLRKMNEKSSELGLVKWEPPALELDVYISENHMEKLIVFKEDSPNVVADKFCKKYNLGDDKKELLLSVIREQVSKVLTCISEEDDEEI